jgi:ribokinase
VTNHAMPPAGVVIVVGAINLDLVVSTQRLPGPGETVVGAGPHRHGGGKGANAAVAAARLGAAVRLIGAVGTDDNGSAALAELVAEGVDISGVQRLDSEPTGVALIVVDAAGENQIAVGAGANSALDPGHVHEVLQQWASQAQCVLVSTEIPGPAVLAALEVAAAAGIACVLNPAPPIPSVLDALKYRPILTPNSTEGIELAALLGSPAADPVESAAIVAARSRAPVVLTLGGDGCAIVTDGQEVTRVPARPVLARDTTGAGDTFNGALAAGISSGLEIPDAVRIATVAASMSVRSLGARSGMPSRDGVQAAL